MFNAIKTSPIATSFLGKLEQLKGKETAAQHHEGKPVNDKGGWKQDELTLSGKVGSKHELGGQKSFGGEKIGELDKAAPQNHAFSMKDELAGMKGELEGIDAELDGLDEQTEDLDSELEALDELPSDHGGEAEAPIEQK